MIKKEDLVESGGWFNIDDLPNEIWHPFPLLKGGEVFTQGYLVSNWGRIKAKGNGKRNAFYKGQSHICRTGFNRDGYEVIRITYHGVSKTFTVHKLVASSFIENPCGFKEINHKNEIKDDNRVSNLEWCSRSYNMKYGKGVKEGKRKMLQSTYFQNLVRAVDKFDLNGVYICSYNSVSDAARAIGKPQRTTDICNCCKNKSKTAYGYKWQYAR